MNLEELIKKENWGVHNVRGTKEIEAYGQRFAYTHPVQIYLKLYRTEQNPELKYMYMKAAHDYLWPKTLWHYWTETRFRTHCDNYNYISWAGGASTAKSYDAAKIALLFWLANPRRRAIVVASTTLESLGARVWGYCTGLLSEIAVKLPFQYLGGQSPKILYPLDKSDKSAIRDSRHAMFAIAAKSGDDDKAISSTIGRHPDDALMVILDECTDLNTAIARAFPNLDSGEKPFQLIGIGNSNSMYDLHGALSTPKNGWPSVDPLRDTQWETVQKKGICLFFGCYNSPAVHESDPVRRKKLSQFLITQEQIDEKEKLLGKESDLFYRFVLGFWKSTSTDRTVMSKQFLDGFDIKTKAEWLGVSELHRVAGLDPAFSTGGDKCILRLGILGQTVDGGVVLDLRGSDLLFDIRIRSSHGRSGKSAELQIAEQVCDILQQHNVQLKDLAIDSNGQGRALGGTIYLEMARRVGQLHEPLKIYSTRGGSNVVNSFGMIIKTSLELWGDVRKYLEHNQIKGIDEIAAAQLAHRWIIQDKVSLKQRLETKAEFKKRMGAVLPNMAHSPDEADSVALCLQSAIHNYGFTLGQRKDAPRVETFAHEKLLAYQGQQRVVMQQESSVQFPLADFSGTVEDYAALRSKI
jgi:hypothetical protein